MLADKLKSAKNDVQRKEQMIKELKDKPVMIARSYIDGPTDKNDSLIEEQKKKLKDLKQRHKVDLEVKDNLIRSLKQKIEQQLEIIELKENDSQQENNMNMPL